MPSPLILASASPRRADLLRAAGIGFEVVPADIDERVHEHESADAYVRRLAEAKANVVRQRHPGQAVLAADTVVVVGTEILGKPKDAADAHRMLRLLSGRFHQVLTGVALARSAGERLHTRVSATSVEFARLSETEIHWYVDSGEPHGKAGAYAIQGLGSRFVTRINGSYSNVVGLPVAVVYELCTAAGILLF